jgi:hypothetical protein
MLLLHVLQTTQDVWLPLHQYVLVQVAEEVVAADIHHHHILHPVEMVYSMLGNSVI